MRSPHRGRRCGQMQSVCLSGRFLQFCLPALFALLALSPNVPLAGTGSASISTDQSEYLLGDTVVFTGAGYGAGEIVLMEVQRLDGTVYDSWTVTASSTGSFTTAWPSTVNLYEGVVLEAAAEADPSGLVATTTFVLAPPAVSLEQMRNGAAGSPASPINWVNGNAGASNSHLTEKWSQAYRAVFTDLTAGDTIEFVVGYDITHSGKHAIDYLTYYDRINDPAHTSLYGHAQETIDPLLGVGALPGPVYAPIPPPPLSSCTLVVPNPPGPAQLQPCTSFDNLDNDPTQVRMTLYGGAFSVPTPVSYDAAGDPTQAQSEARVRVKFVAGGSTAVLLWGGHLASNTDWGAGNSASGISGSPYHSRAIELRVNGDLKNVGNQDRSLSAEAVAPCDVTITCPPNKTIACTESTDPSNTGTPTYTANNACGTVTLTYHDAVSGACPVTILRTWVAMGSGGGDSCIQTITVVDTLKPTLVGCPANVTVSCGAVPAPATVTATDNCDPSVAVVYSQTSSLSGCGGYTGTITRKWVATDDCGNKDSCLQTITVVDTQAPTCNIGAGPFNFTQCAPAAVTIPVSATDNCDASVTCAVAAGPGTVSAGNWTYTPSGDESFSVTIRCTDDCGNYCEQSFNVTFAINDPPACATVSDTTYFQCAPTQVCRPVSATDPNGNLSGCAVVAGPGTVSDGNWCYTPSGDETVNVTIRCTDACGAFCEESFSVTFVINDRPVCSPIADTSYFQCAPTQVCRPYGSTDPNGNLSGCAIVSGPGTLSGGNWCYTPSGDETVSVTIRCTDACGAFCDESFSVTFQINDPPVVDLGSDISLPQTFPQNPVCFNYTVSDPNGLAGITETLVGAPGGTSFDTSLNQICFTPPGTGIYEFIVSATDPCGASDVDTLYVLISATQPPVCNLPGDTSVLQCTPTQICLPVSATGIHGPVTCAVTSGPGTVAGGQWCYTPVGDGAVTVTITCTDTLGVTCSGSFTVTFEINDAPVCSPIADTSYFQCAPTQVCRPYGSTDPNGNLTGCAIVSGPGTLSGGNWCYTPTGNETVNVTISCTDACGAFCEESFSVTFVINDAPVCSPIADTTYFQCAPTQVCRPYGSTDPNGNLTGCAIVSGPGTLSGGNWCYTPTGNETVNVTISCTDACGAFCEESFSVTFVINDAPVCSPIADTSYFQCAPTQVCRPYASTDANGNLTGCAIVSGPGTLSGGNWCYTPTGDETVNVTIRCTDACGAFCEESFSVTFVINDAPICSPIADTTYFQCAPTQVCRPYGSTDPNGNLTGCAIVSGPGTLSGGNWCYTPTGDETVNVTIRCTDACGALCEESFSVTFDINDAPVCSPIADTSYFQCAPTQVCRPYGSTDPNGNLTGCAIVSGPGTLSGGNWCYTPTGDETVNVTIRCTDACGAFCEESFSVTFDINDAPVCSPIADTSYFQCAPTQVCRPYGSTDPNGNLTGCAIVSGPGTLSGGNWCYTPTGDETVNVTIRCTDACGAFCEESFSVTFMIGMPPQIVCAPNATYTCDTQVPPCSPSDVTVTGGAGTVTVTCQSSNNGGTGCPGNPLIYTYTYTATDSCGAQAQCVRTLTVIDNVAPTLSGCPANVTIACNAPLPPPATVTAADNCDPSVAVTLSETSNLTGCGGNTGTVTRVWTATDDCGNSVSCTQVITIQDTQAPTCNIPSDSVIRLQCAPAKITVPVSATDNCDPAVICDVVAGPGTVIYGNWEYTPVSEGTFEVTIRCTDDCGNFCEGSFVVSVQFNDPPTIALGPDQSVFQCAPAPICVNYTVSDPNTTAGLTETLLSGPPGAVLNAGADQVCFTPAGAGAYTIIVRASDHCGASDVDTVVVNVSINAPPTISFGPDLTRFLCAPAPLCIGYSASDPNGNALTEVLLSGPSGATLNAAADQVCFTPSASGNYTFIVRVQDTCGASDVDTVSVIVTLNLPPIAVGPNDTSLFQCAPAPFCLPVGGIDPEGRPLVITKINGPGTIAAGQWCYTPSGDETVNVTFRVTDSCGLFDDESFAVTFNLNSPPVCQVPNDTTIVMACSLRTVALPVSASDPDGGPVTCQVVSGSGTIVDGMWTVTPSGPGNYCAVVRCTDPCGAVCEETFCVSVLVNNDDCNCLFKVSVNEGASINALNGQLVTVPVKFDLTGVPVGGFDLLLCWDASAISLVDVDKGLAIADWEYFTYRIGVSGNCTGSTCPSGMVRLVGIAEMNNGVPVDPSAFLPIGTVADLSFVVTSDRNFIHQCIPIRFCWYDCADNTISSKSGDTTFLEISFVYDTCQSNPKGDPVPAICFENGRICIQEPPDDRGDINLNGIANEVGDAVLFTNYFLFGGTVWDPVWSQVQILATDVNDDGIVLTVADLIYLIRIITGDEQPFPPGGHPKLAPYAHTGTATLRREDGYVTVATNAPVDIGGLLLVFRADGIATGEPELLRASAGLNVRAHRDGSELRLLVHPSWSAGRAVIPSGRHDVLAIPTTGSGQLELVEVQMSDAQGALLSAGATQAFVPGDYALMQNYPNPFNAGTVISFNLKEASDWTVTIYNVMGQTIRGFSGTADASTVNVEWNGQDANGTTVASGIYFYRVSTPAWSATKRMTLIR